MCTFKELNDTTRQPTSDPFIWACKCSRDTGPRSSSPNTTFNSPIGFLKRQLKYHLFNDIRGVETEEVNRLDEQREKEYMKKKETNKTNG